MCHAIESCIKRETTKFHDSVLARKKCGTLARFRASPQQKKDKATEWAVAPLLRNKDNYVRRRMRAVFYKFGGCTIILSQEPSQ